MLMMMGMDKSLALAAVVFVTLLELSSGEMFTSLAHMEQLLHTERDLATDIETYVKEEQARLDNLKRVAHDYSEHSRKALSDKDQYLGNPVNAYFLLKRLTLEWSDVQAKYIHSIPQAVLTNKLKQREAMLPGTEDFTGAINALLRLQDTYRISAERFASGNFVDNRPDLKSPELTAMDCFLFGQNAYNTYDYYHAILWLEESLRRLPAVATAKDPKRGMLLDYLSFAVFKQGDIKRSFNLTQELLLLEPNHERARNNLNYFESVLSHAVEPPRYMSIEEFRYEGLEYKTSDEYYLYEKLCRGESTKRGKKKPLTCRYVTNNHPLLILTPAKEETVHDKPWIVVYHDIIPDYAMERIKRLAAPRLGRATVQDPATGNLVFAHYRISKSAWLKNYDDPIVERVVNIMEAVTKLTMKTAEELQIANYGVGGHYEPHFDFARSNEPDSFKSLGTGNRIATFLLYMTDVYAGGATVFPHIGVKLFPKKGTAAFWHNLYRSGKGDEMTRHAACPVLVGTKWVANKWIHERGQEFRRPCALDRNL